jgi:hypothetical protein
MQANRVGKPCRPRRIGRLVEHGTFGNKLRRHHRHVRRRVACSWDREKLRFNPLRDVQRQEAFGQHQDLASEDGLELDLDSRQVVEGGARRRIDQDIEIALIVVLSAGRRAEDARISHAETLQDLTDPVAVVLKGYGRSHDRTRAPYL